MPGVPDPVPDMRGKTCLVTGATAGIGAVTAEALAGAGATVLMIGRNAAKCGETTARIRGATGNTAVYPFVADLSSQSQVRRLAEEVVAQHPQLDVLVNNAGAMFNRRVESADGIEMTWALNHLAYFLLTDLLLDNLKASAPARIVNVASEAHRSSRGIRFDNPEFKTSGYRAFGAYCQSKLANVLFTQELARRLVGTRVTANSLHPGFVYSSFFENKGAIGALFKVAATLIAISPENGARTSVYLATSPEVADVSGQYFDRRQPAVPARAARDPEGARRLWELSAAMTRQTAS
jgi:NAD(P)-dependent dehydrogenase (short-subunit alcohol dehydrogenase family)